MLICLGCQCDKLLARVEEDRKAFEGVVRSIQVWMLARGDLQEHDAKMVRALEYHLAVGLDSGDVSTDVSYPGIEHA